MGGSGARIFLFVASVTTLLAAKCLGGLIVPVGPSDAKRENAYAYRASMTNVAAESAHGAYVALHVLVQAQVSDCFVMLV